MTPRWFIVIFTIEFAVALLVALWKRNMAYVVYFAGATLLNIGILMGFK